MKHFKQLDSLPDDKWERIQQLEAELNVLYQSALMDDDFSTLIDTHHSIFEHVSDAVISCGLDSTIKSWNRAAAFMCGFTRDEAVGQNIRELLQSQPLSTTWDEIEFQIQSAGKWSGEIICHHKDGDEIIAEVTISPLLNDDYEPIGILAIQRDITERYHREQHLHERVEKRTQELVVVNQQLQTSEKWYQMLIRNFPNGVVGLVNHDLQFEFLGGEGEIHLSYQGEALQGRRLADIMPPEIARRDEPALRAALQGETQVQTVEYQDRMYRVHTLPIRDDDGNITSAMVMSQDITELVRTREQIEAHEERYRMLFHSIPDMVFILNQNMEFLLANQTLADSLETTTDAIRGQSIATLFEGVEDSVFYENYKLSLSDGHPRVIVGEQTLKGVTNWYEARLLPLQDELLVIKRDVTLQRKANQQTLQDEVARARNHTRDEIVHNLAHDLRTPLTTINTSLYLLDKYTDPVKQKQKVGSLKHQVEHLQQMIENILLLTELDVYQSSDLIRADVRQIMIDLVNAFASRTEKKELQVITDMPDEPLYHAIHPEHFVHALTHVLNNAVIYSNTGGTIHVSLSHTPSHAFTVTVKDTGIGISAEHLPHIFERFYRADAARTMNEAGMGLGLTIAQQIIELHHGHIIIASEPNQGTEARIII